jgi:UDP-hydrolysing UDP-N-acetyl-D-glucosamine 2-epimerase
MHLLPQFGLTSKIIEDDGFEIADKIDLQIESDKPEYIAKSIGVGVIGFARSFSEHRPEILLVLGDRFEMFAATVAALPLRIPVGHIHGGELSEGAIDDALRHSITKMSHIHFVANEVYKRRVIQLGEEPWRVIVSGAPALDNLSQLRFLNRSQLEERHKINLVDPVLLVTYHPVTLEYEESEKQMIELLSALDNAEGTLIFTYPNADSGSQIVVDMLNDYCSSRKRAHLVVNLGTQSYFSLMRLARVMVGNSSSGIIEAASFRLPVVNIGNRQRGRLRGSNVIDAANERQQIEKAIKTALTTSFRESLKDLQNPYGSGGAANIISATLKNLELSERLLIKQFHDLAK